MVSFSLKKVSKVEKKGSFAVKKKTLANKTSLLSDEKIVKEDEKIEITTFDGRTGASDKNASTPKEPLVIKQHLRSSLRKSGANDHSRPEEGNKNPLSEVSSDQEARRSVLRDGTNANTLTIPLAGTVERQYGESPDEEAYERIPVESFGEALLRGMGWQGGKAPAASQPKAASSSYLGLGAKHIPQLDSKDKDYSPLVRRKRQR